MRRLLLLGGGAIIILAGLYTLISSAYTHAHTGVVEVDTNRPSATITINGAGATSKKYSKGSTTARLAPGDYAVTATDGQSSSSTSITVSKKQTTSVTLSLQDLAPVTSLVQFTARSIFVDATGVTFLNNPFHVLFKVAAGSTSALPYDENVYPISRVYWIDGQHAYIVSQAGVLSYLSGITQKQVTAPGVGSITPDSISMNTSGQLALSVGSTIYFVATPGGQATVLAKEATGTYGVSLSQNDTVIINDTTEQPDDSKGTPHQQTILVSAGDKKTTLAHSLDYISANSAWAPDSQSFVYAAKDGLYLYDATTGATTKLITDQPTHPGTVTWLDATHFMYAQGSVIWKYDTKQHVSTKLSAIVGSLDPSEPFAIGYDHRVYYGTDPTASGTGGSIYSFAL